MDYRALNSHIVKYKFIVSVVLELLNNIMLFLSLNWICILNTTRFAWFPIETWSFLSFW